MAELTEVSQGTDHTEITFVADALEKWADAIRDRDSWQRASAAKHSIGEFVRAGGDPQTLAEVAWRVVANDSGGPYTQTVFDLLARGGSQLAAARLAKCDARDLDRRFPRVPTWPESSARAKQVSNWMYSLYEAASGMLVGPRDGALDGAAIEEMYEVWTTVLDVLTKRAATTPRKERVDLLDLGDFDAIAQEFSRCNRHDLALSVRLGAFDYYLRAATTRQARETVDGYWRQANRCGHQLPQWGDQGRMLLRAVERRIASNEVSLGELTAISHSLDTARRVGFPMDAQQLRRVRRVLRENLVEIR